jgi:hypothetical protein
MRALTAKNGSASSNTWSIYIVIHCMYNVATCQEIEAENRRKCPSWAVREVTSRLWLGSCVRGRGNPGTVHHVYMFSKDTIRGKNPEKLRKFRGQMGVVLYEWTPEERVVHAACYGSAVPEK